MVDPKIMCDKHLLGEHVEIHMFVGALQRKKKIDGYIKNNCLEPQSIVPRHEILKREMKKRNFNHRSPIELVDISYLKEKIRNYKIDILSSKTDLLNRCKKCRKLNEEYAK